MSVINEDLKEAYQGDGVTTEFDVDFKVQDESHLLVQTKVVATGVVTTKEITTDYTVSIDADEGAIVTMLTAPAAGTNLYILSNAPFTQELEIDPDAAFPEEGIENAFDKGTILLKQLTERVTRSLKFPSTSASSDLEPTLPEPNPGKGLIWDATGAALINTDDDVNGILAGAQAAQAAAEAAQGAAETAQTAAEAAQALAEAVIVQTDFVITDGQSAADVDGYLFSPSAYSSVMCTCEILRGTTVFGILRFELHYFSAGWDVVIVEYNTKSGRALHGLTFTMNGNQLQVAADSGAGDGTGKIKQNSHTVAA